MGKHIILYPASALIYDTTDHILKAQYGGEPIVNVTFGHVKDDDFPYGLPLSEYMRKSIVDGLMSGQYDIRHDPDHLTHVVINKATGEEIPRLAASIY